MADAPEEIVKVHATIIADPPTGETTQGADDPYLGTPRDAITPPVPLEQLAAWTQMNGVRSSCIAATVTNTVGLGYVIGLAEGEERDVSDVTDDVKRARAELEALARRDERRKKPTLTSLLRAAKWDEQEVGNGYIEVARNRTDGRISGLFHLPAKRVRRLADRSGYLILPPDGDENKATRFYNFGDKVLYTRAGVPQDRLKTPQNGWARNEVIAFENYTSESRDYGLPKDAALSLEYLGDKLSAQSNVGFFDSSGTPPTVLFVQGEEKREAGRGDGAAIVNVTVPAETSARIAATLKSDGGRQNRVAIIPVPAGAKVTKEELGKISERDMGFVDFRDDIRSRTLGAFRLGGVFVTGAGDSRYGAEVERALTKEQVFDPEQTEWQERLHETILNDLGYAHLALTFNDLAVEDDAAGREGATRMAEAGAITRREFRKAYGYAPLPESATEADPEDPAAKPEPGKVPRGWNDEIIEIGQPAGAENRTDDAADQRGLAPGVGARTARSGPGAQPRGARGTPDAVEGTVRALAGQTGRRKRSGKDRATARARALVDAE